MWQCDQSGMCRAWSVRHVVCCLNPFVFAVLVPSSPLRGLQDLGQAKPSVQQPKMGQCLAPPQQQQLAQTITTQDAKEVVQLRGVVEGECKWLGYCCEWGSKLASEKTFSCWHLNKICRCMLCASLISVSLWQKSKQGWLWEREYRCFYSVLCTQ